MNFFEAASTRYSHRSALKPTPVPHGDLLKIVTAGAQAPSGCNAQTTYFSVVTDSTLLAGLSEIIDSDAVRTAPAIIVVSSKYVPHDFGPAHPNMAFEVEDYAAAVQNMLLAVTALGYATCWYDGAARIYGNDTRIAKLLGIADNLQVRTVLPIGIPVTIGKQGGRRPLEERVNWL